MQGMFLRAGRQDVALQMRQDLRQWGAALRLAERCAPEQVIRIKQHHAEALEMQGDFGAALQYFQVGFDPRSSSITFSYQVQVVESVLSSLSPNSIDAGSNLHQATKQRSWAG